MRLEVSVECPRLIFHWCCAWMVLHLWPWHVLRLWAWQVQLRFISIQLMIAIMDEHDYLLWSCLSVQVNVDVDGIHQAATVESFLNRLQAHTTMELISFTSAQVMLNGRLIAKCAHAFKNFDIKQVFDHHSSYCIVSGIYIGETSRTFKARCAEHWQHSTMTPEVLQNLHLQGREKHQISVYSLMILDHDSDKERRGIKEWVYICMHHQDLNRHGGHHQLCHIWDSILQASCDLWSQRGERQVHNH